MSACSLLFTLVVGGTAVRFQCGATTDEYIEACERKLEVAFEAFRPDFVIYNAGTGPFTS